VIFKNLFKNKKVLLTGHTGFKGSWLGLWLNRLGAKVIGVSKDIPTKPAHFSLKNNFYYKNIRFDLKNSKKVSRLIMKEKPDFIFHLAAQPIVLASYEDPYTTYLSNTLGTLNILESLRLSNHRCYAVMITSDKCYENLNMDIQYKESDRLGGLDPYSSSKASAELMIRSYYEAFFSKPNSKIRIASARAGNVMGGGDWAENRIVPDCMKSWFKNKQVILRSPKSTRPWQHVLEPLSGYLTLAAKLNSNKKLSGESFNFGPKMSHSYSVKDLVSKLSSYLEYAEFSVKPRKKESYEAILLSLDIGKARRMLNWRPMLTFNATAKWTAEWYKSYYKKSKLCAYEHSLQQIEDYEKLLKNVR
tara:strand:+ start:536 stop:1615 length:1080 start_codon:yes stop_codon:yes gene_type:complete